MSDEIAVLRDDIVIFGAAALLLNCEQNIPLLFSQKRFGGSTLILRSILKEVESRGGIDMAQAYGCFCRPNREKQGCFRKNRKPRRKITC